MNPTYECPNCGRSLKKGEFCPRCGEKAVETYTYFGDNEDHTGDPRYNKRGRAKLFKS